MRLRFEHTVPAPRDAVFRFHSDPKNLGVLLANRKGFRLIAHEGHVRPGAVTRIVDSIGPLPIAITFEHVSFEPPSAFEERMVHGPFERFVHRHEFHDRGGTTHVVDLLDVRLPPWLGGELVLRMVVQPLLARAFAFRHSELVRLAHDGELSPLTYGGS